MKPPLRAAALCAGYGGLEIGLQLADIPIELDWYSEIDKNASKVMAHHWPNATNLGDLTQITDPPQVDIMTAGFPCQPFSQAGKRAGVNDERWLIDDVTDLARRSGVRWLLLENVRGLLSANDGDAMARVCAALARNGFDAEWTTVRASDIGAPHRRERCFCLAWDVSRHGRNEPPDEGSGLHWQPAFTTRGPNGAAPHPYGQRPQERGLSKAEERVDVTDAAGGSGFGPYAAAVARWESVIGRPAPSPLTYPGGRPGHEGLRQAVGSDAQHEPPQRDELDIPGDAGFGVRDNLRLNPGFVEWMMGLPEGHVTDVIDKRGSALKMLGNGVVPQQAALAIHTLIDQANS